MTKPNKQFVGLKASQESVSSLKISVLPNFKSGKQFHEIKFSLL